MQSIMNKKGVSGVVATLFLILSSIFALSVVGYTVLGYIDLSPQISCTEAQIQPPVTISSAIYNPDTKEVEVTLQRSLQESVPVNSLEFTILSDSESNEFSCSDSCGNCIVVSPGTSEKYYFSVEEFVPQRVILGISGCTVEARTLQ